tara:strand:+ start:1144 stop:1308 length:165 start_codon:yes stop_codon:yes gene_type:complete
MKIEYKLMVREPNDKLRIEQYSESRAELEYKAEVLLEKNPSWQVFVVKENYNVS